jgi:GNAT superfamily N-acetyltransferase
MSLEEKGGNVNAEPVRIRQLEVQDAPLVTQFVAALLQEVDGELIGEEVFKRYTLLCQELLSEKESYIGFLAEAAQRKPLGVITLGHSAALYAGGRIGIIHELYVIAEARSRGVGRHLLLAAAEYARACGWVRLEVSAPDGTAWARTVAFYQRQGFLPIGPRLKLVL